MSANLPPIVKLAERLMLEVERAVRAFPRYHKYSLGQELRQQCRDVVRLCYRAWRARDQQHVLLPALVASFIFAFIGSFDEAIVTSFLASIGFVTLPVEIFSSVRFGVDPVITAIATLLTLSTALLMVMYGMMRRRT